MWKLAEDTISHADLDALADWLRTFPRLTQGELVAEFEAEWSRWLGVDHSVMVSSGTTANFALIAVLGARLGRPPRVGVSAVTWSTNISPSLLLNFPVTVFDIDASTLGVREELVCGSIERREIDVLFVTHLLGLTALTDRILDAAARNGVLVIEDCCEAHGARLGEQRVGSLGLAGTFSFYFGHHMSTIEGGMVSTNDPSLADELRLMRAHGLARESARFDELVTSYPDIDPSFLFVSAGLNFRSSDLNAFLGLRQLPRLDARIEQRNANLSRLIARAPDWLWGDFMTDGVSSFALPLIATTRGAADHVASVLRRLEIETRPIVAGNLLRQPFLAETELKVVGGADLVADHVHDLGSYVGNGHHVSPDMVDTLIDALNEGTLS